MTTFGPTCLVSTCFWSCPSKRRTLADDGYQLKRQTNLSDLYNHWTNVCSTTQGHTHTHTHTTSEHPSLAKNYQYLGWSATPSCMTAAPCTPTRRNLATICLILDFLILFIYFLNLLGNSNPQTCEPDSNPIVPVIRAFQQCPHLPRAGIHCQQSECYWLITQVPSHHFCKSNKKKNWTIFVKNDISFACSISQKWRGWEGRGKNYLQNEIISRNGKILEIFQFSGYI